MARHKLVAIGDSLTQGLMSGAVCDPGLAYPAHIGQAMGLAPEDFSYPTFPEFGGAPLNIEFLLRRLEAKCGPDLGCWDLSFGPVRVRRWIDAVEDLWERGRRSRARGAAPRYHNLASWGMTVDDALYLTAGECMAQSSARRRDNCVRQMPQQIFYRLALDVLNPTRAPGRMSVTAIDAAAGLAADGGIENVVVTLGANNALGTITKLEVNCSEPSVLTAPSAVRGHFNLWLPEHFEVQFLRLADRLEELQAERVFLATVPHVTIAPLARGVGSGPPDRLAADPRYFKFYTYFWITDSLFEPGLHPHLTGEQARAIDQIIDAYNSIIRLAVAQRRQRGLAWHVVDICDALDRVAFRRYREAGLTPKGGTYEFCASWNAALAAQGLLELTTQFLCADEHRLRRGGLFSLDGLHPTVMCQGLLAHEFIEVMRRSGVTFVAPEQGGSLVDFAKVLSRDQLVSRPPAVLDDTVAVLHWLEEWANLSKLLRRLA